MKISKKERYLEPLDESLEFYNYVNGLNPTDCCSSFVAEQLVVDMAKRNELTKDRSYLFAVLTSQGAVISFRPLDFFLFYCIMSCL